MQLPSYSEEVIKKDIYCNWREVVAVCSLLLFKNRKNKLHSENGHVKLYHQLTRCICCDHTSLPNKIKDQVEYV
jgi:hypothetical protein